MTRILPVGKVPRDVLERLLAHAPTQDPHVLLGPGIGIDCAVVEVGETLLVVKSDPITFASDAIGWYLVQISTNDLATTGATPRWLLITMLLPEARTTVRLVEQISQDVYRACREIGVTVIGGHTEITAKLDRPILVGTLIGTVDRARLVTPQGARAGDQVLLTKGVPIEATALLAREFPGRARQALSAVELRQARAFLYDPGISVLRDARIAQQAGQVTAMHDPTEGGLATALWELAEASGRALTIDPRAVHIPPLAARLCKAFNLDPLAAIASGALLLTASASDAPQIRHALAAAGIACTAIGEVAEGSPAVWRMGTTGREPFPRPVRDAIAHVYEG
jgi:hydrogenase expression/formation protein HypE